MSKRNSNSRPKTDSSNAKTNAPKRSTGLMALEPRVLLDAAGFVAGAEVAIDVMSQTDGDMSAQALFMPAPMTQSFGQDLNGVTLDPDQIIWDRDFILDRDAIPNLDMSGLSEAQLEGLTGLAVGTEKSVIDFIPVSPEPSPIAPIIEDIGYTPEPEKPITEDIGYTPDETASGSTVVFVDTSVSGYEALIADIDPDHEIVLIGEGVDGVELMAETLAGRNDVAAVHIFSHGSVGALDLGTATLDAASITGAYADEMAVIKSALTTDADILIYGCDFGADASSVSALALATGADIAASDDDTGAALVGGDWDLEIIKGMIEAESLVAAGFTGLLVDSDGDGIDDSVDVDDDNDGILDVTEGYQSLNGFTIGTIELTENGDGSGEFRVPVINLAGDEVGFLTVDYFGFNGDGGGQGGPATNVFTPEIQVGTDNGEIAIQLIYALPDVDGHNYGYSISSTNLDFADVEHNVQGAITDAPNAPGRVEDSLFTIDHTLSSDPTVANNAVTGSHTIGSGGGVDLAVNDTLSNGSQFTRSGSNAGPGVVNRFLDIGFALASGESYGVNAVYDNIAPEGRESTSFVLRTPVVVFRDTDGDGIADHLDIDADNDGITDNIEGQTTASYIAPSGVGGTPDFIDLNQDGLDDNYDIRTVTAGDAAATVAEAVIVPVDTDNDGDDDYVETNSDNEGGNDTVEAGLGTDAVTGLSDASTDADGDGLFDVFETQNGTTPIDGFDVNESIATGAIALPDTDGDAAAGTPLTADVDFRDAESVLDTDGDGIADDIDVDDDNDGILDVDEGYVPPPGTAGTIGDDADLSFDVTATANSDGQNLLNILFGADVSAYTSNVNLVGGGASNGASQVGIFTDLNQVTDISGNAGAFADISTGVVFSTGFLTELVTNNSSDFIGPGAAGLGNFDADFGPAEFDVASLEFQITLDAPQTFTGTFIFGSDEYLEYVNSGFFDAAKVFVNGTNVAVTPDGTDLSIDSINPNVNSDLYIDNPFLNPTVNFQPDGFTVELTFTVTLDAGVNTIKIGVADIADTQASSWLFFTSGSFAIPALTESRDTDGDGIADYLDLDSDNDGISDNIEAQSTAGYIAPSGTGSAMVDTNGDGLDDAYDTGIVNVGDTSGHSGTGLTPVNSDSGAANPDSTPDYLDTDSDNDGLNDTVEAGLGSGPVTGISDASTDADGDGWFDVFETQLDGNANDGYVVNDGVTPLDGTLPDGGGDASIGTATPLVNDLDFRDLNDDPFAQPDAETTAADTVLSDNVLTDNGNGADVDPDGNGLTVTQINGTAITSGAVITLPSGALLTMNDDGSYDYDPNGQFDSLALGESATDSFTYQISDGQGGFSDAVVTLTVDGVNDVIVPQIPGDPNVPADRTDFIPQQIGDDNTAPAPLDLNTFFTDPDSSDVVTFTADPADLPSGLTITNGVISGTLDDSASQGGINGVYTIPVTVTDGNGDTFTTTVEYVVTNPAPIAQPDAEMTDADSVLSENVLTDNGSGVDIDPDGDTLTVTQVNGVGITSGSVITLPSGALLTMNDDGSYDYDPNGQYDSLAVGESATDSFTYQISDGEGGFSDSVITLTIDGVNDVIVPQIPGDPNVPADRTDFIPAQSGDDNTAPAPLDLNTFFTDPDSSDVVTFTADPADLPSGLTMTNGVISGTLDDSASQGGVNGVYTIPVTVTDSNGDTFVTSVEYTVTNPAPTAQADTEATNEDTVMSDSVLTDNGNGADTDPDGDVLTVTEVNGVAIVSGDVITLPSGALLTMNADGSYDYDPNGQFEGLAVGQSASDSFTYQISDGEGGFDTATITIAIDGVNDAPDAIDDGLMVDENTAASGDVLTDNGNGADSDPDADPLLVSQVNGVAITSGAPITLASGALLTMNSDGTYDYDPNGQFENLQLGTDAIDSFTYTIDDGNGGADVATVTITVNGVNDAPIAQPDAATLSADTVLTADVLIDNGSGLDSDVDGDVLTVSQVNGVAITSGSVITLPSGALLTMNDDGSYDYDPNGQFDSLALGESATDSFTYQISDGQGGFSDAVATLTVDGVNDVIVPQIPGDPNIPADRTDFIPQQIGDDNTAPAPLDLNTFFTDPDSSDVVTFTADPADLPSGLTMTNGVISGTLDDSASQGGINGVYTIPVTVTDGNGDTFTTTVEYVVTNPAPEAVNDSFTTAEETPLTANIITGSDSDSDGDVLTVDSAALPDGTVIALGTATVLPEGTLTVEADGSVTFDPAENYNGDFIFGYTVTDSEGSTDAATVTLTVTPVNDGPQPNVPGDPNPPADPNAYIPVQTGTDNTPVTDLVLTPYFTDVDNSDAELTLSLDPNDLPAGLTWDPVTETISGTPDSSASQGGVNGTYAIEVTVTDPDGESFMTTVTYTFNNEAPNAQNDAATLTEDGSLSSSVLTDNGSGADIDPDGDILTVTEVNGVAIISGDVITLPSGALLTMNSDGSYDYDPSGQFEGLGAGETAIDSFTYEISDGEGGTDIATVTLTVEGVNDAPIPVDPNGPITDATNYIPVQNGTDAVAQTPLDLTPYFGDPDSTDVLTISVDPSDLPSGLTLENGVIVGTPDNSASQGGVDGVYEIAVTATDPSGATFTTTLTYVIENPAPTAQDDIAIANEDSAITGSVIADNGNGTDIDPDGDALFVSEVNGDAANVGAPISGSDDGQFTVNPDGSYSFDPSGDFEDLAAGETRTTTISYEISDGEGGVDSATVTVTVEGVNDAPIAVNPADPLNPPADVNDYIPAQTGTDNSPITPLDLTPYFGDPDGTDAITLSVDPADLPPGLIFENGVISGTPDNSASQGGIDGVYAIDVTATDPSGATFTTTVTYTFENPAPVAVNDVFETPEDTPLSVNVITGSDSDPDGDVLTIDAVALPDGTIIPIGTPTELSQGTLTVGADGSVTLDPAPDYFGQLIFGYTVTDSEGGTDMATVTIDVTPVNDTPVVVDPNNPDIPPADPLNYIPQQTGDDSAPQTPLDLNPYFGDADPSDELVISISSGDLPSGLTLVDGVITGTPDASASQGGDPNAPGTYTVSVTATDPSGESVTTQLTYVIDNPAPIASDDGPVAIIEDTPSIIDPLGNDVDPDGDALTITHIDGDPVTQGIASTLPSGASVTLNADGTVTYDPAQNFNGPDSFTYTVDDGQGGTDSAVVSLDVTSVNDAPIVTPPVDGEPALPAQTNDDSDVITGLDVSGPFSDIDGDPLTFTAIGLPDGLSIDSNGIISGVITPGASENGPFTVVVTATDPSGETVSSEFVWDVENVTPEVITQLPSVTIIDGDSVEIFTQSSFADVDGDDLTYTAKGLPVGLTIDPVTGVISGTIDNGESVSGPQEITVTATDSQGASTESVFTLAIDNPAPIIVPVEATPVVAGEAIIINVGENTTDPDGDANLTYSAKGLPPGLVLDSKTGIISGTPTTPSDTPYVIEVTVDDGQGGVTTTTLTLTVNEDGYAPVTAESAIDALHNEPLSVRDMQERLERQLRDFTSQNVDDDTQALSDDSMRDYWGGVIRANVAGYGDAAFIAVEAVAYDHAIYVSLTDSLDGVNVTSWDIDLGRDGAGLPSWVDHAEGSDMLVLNRTVTDGQAKLIIRALADDGRTIRITVTVDMATGAVEQTGQVYAAGSTLSEQVTRLQLAEQAPHTALLKALAG